MSSFWRSEYERVKGDLKATEEQTIDLRREVDALKSKLENSKPTSSSKRKKADEDRIPDPKSPKKAKRDASPSKLAALTTDEIAQFDFAAIGEAGNALMRNFYYIQTTLKNSAKTDPITLARHCLDAADAVPQIVRNALQQSIFNGESRSDHLKNVLVATERSVLALLMAYNRISHVVNGAQVIGQVTYAYVQMYGKLLNKIELIAAKETERAKEFESLPSGTKKSTSKAQPKQPKNVNMKENLLLSSMTATLCNIIDNLDSKNEGHRALFEGFTYMTLEKIGTRLYTLVFGRPREASLEKEIAASDQPDEVEDPKTTPSPDPKEVAIKVAKLEAPYLINVLKHIMSAAPAHLDRNTTTGKASRAKQSRGRALTKNALTVVARERLQRTLVNCVFGTEGVDEDDPFMDCLKAPTAPDLALPMPKVREADVQDWFKEELWRLLGWEILSRDMDWLH